MKASRLALLIGVPVLTSRLPFLLPGYGMEPEAWHLARAARHIGSTGEYVMSRLPGHPLQELVCSLLWRGGPLALNGATAILSAAAAILLGLCVRRVSSGSALLAGLALGFTPLVFRLSCTSMDYVWALTFILGSLYSALAKRPLLAGLLLGCAVGCRITSVVMVLPLGVLCLGGKPPSSRVRSAAMFALAAGGTGALLFAPVLAQERWGWNVLEFIRFQLDFSNRFTPPSAAGIVSMATSRVWGNLGCVAVAVALVAALVRKRRARSSAGQPVDVPIVAGCITGLATSLATFAGFPFQPAYLVPAVPFVLLLLARILARRTFALACMGIAAAGWVDVGRRGVTPGSVFEEHAQRIEDVDYTQRILAESRALASPSKVIPGPWYAKVVALNHGATLGNARFVVHVRSRAQVEVYRSGGYALYFVPGAEGAFGTGLDPLAMGFVPLFESGR